MLQSCTGLKYVYEMDYRRVVTPHVENANVQKSPLVEGDLGGVPLYLFDNHNHAYYFWY
ncbi:MAG: hypothetical protein H6767_08510 [Candidatus Peribacteria bacterium]|nr:MAG: hypothetical protein H6767_08510 [Candidatus Peribacteria bacterium]